MDLVQRLFDGSLMPHGHCLLWRHDLLALHVGGEILIVIAYFAIPSALIHLVRKRNDLVFNWIFLLFAGFILFCGITHLISLVNVWHGYYFIEGVAKVLTGLISIITAVMIWRLVPRALALPSNADLLAKNRELELLEKELVATNQFLEQRVQERTQELEKMAITDSLTGIPNRAEVMKNLKAELERARRYHKGLCVLMIDLDNFKQINDSHGHLSGDRVIVDAANILKNLCRGSDSIGRYGGEEFVVVLPESTIDSAVSFAERVRQEISQQKISSLDQQQITYTCSIGVAEMNSDHDHQTLLQDADKALYRAKFDGRNRVVS